MSLVDSNLYVGREAARPTYACVHKGRVCACMSVCLSVCLWIEVLLAVGVSACVCVHGCVWPWDGWLSSARVMDGVTDGM
mmetsp:Transcript_7094/g.17283  ORF Transcript_7094/g.17283 Transcript_7094/m.17283 type:complete len:80 (+) Transcript_7094:378-617(+)